MSEQTYPNVRHMVVSLAEAAPEPLTYDELLDRRPPARFSQPRGWRIAVAVAFIAFLVVALPLIILGPFRDQSPAVPTVKKGLLIDSERGPAPDLSRFVPSPDGTRIIRIEDASWCIDDLPSTEPVGSGEPLTALDLSAGALRSRCTDSPLIIRPIWSPDGSRILGLESKMDPDVSSEPIASGRAFVIDAASFAVEAVMDDVLFAVAWASESEIVDSLPALDWTWQVRQVDGDGRRDFVAPRPFNGRVVLMDDGTIAYVTVNQEAFRGEGVPLEAQLVTVDPATGATTELGPLSDLNPGGFAPDPGYLVGVTSDLQYAVLMAFGLANETGEGPTTYVYDVASQVTISHVPPGSPANEMTYPASLVGEDWVAYTAIPDRERPDDPSNHWDVYVAPLADPSAAVRVFSGGILWAEADGRLFIGPEGGGLAILDLDR